MLFNELALDRELVLGSESAEFGVADGPAASTCLRRLDNSCFSSSKKDYSS
ncbi:hypothetical protein KIN20_036973 [Parelaphostrongylus tenuis]|uniref:Uncharacterized protein n=1 Tax=Parelaphostrongylus tenuis TaxID=148309 RepID=A0AAD5RDQ6_PARTN|nr:hypothetical protein KIN20_036973 [Parelaphostrongylus tenuis]